MIVVRRSLLGASHESSTCAIAFDGNSMFTNATSGVVGMMQPRESALMWLGVSSSQYRRIEKSWGPRSHVTLESDWCRPRFTRLVEIEKISPTSPAVISSRIMLTGGL